MITTGPCCEKVATLTSVENVLSAILELGEDANRIRERVVALSRWAEGKPESDQGIPHDDGPDTWLPDKLLGEIRSVANILQMIGVEVAILEKLRGDIYSHEMLSTLTKKG